MWGSLLTRKQTKFGKYKNASFTTKATKLKK